jgi:prevent-host-death family protein
MKVVNIREARATLASLIEEAQNEPVCLARQGKPVAVLQGVEGNDLETVLLEHSRTFWEEIERRRKSPRPRRSLEAVRSRLLRRRRRAG